MVSPSPVAVVPAQCIDAVDVLPLLARIRGALEACLTVPRLEIVDEQEVSGVYVGLVDLQQRLRRVARICHEHDAPGLQAARTDLLARGAVAVALLEALTALHRLPGHRSDTPSIALAIRERIQRLQRAYGRALFA